MKICCFFTHRNGLCLVFSQSSNGLLYKAEQTTNVIVWDSIIGDTFGFAGNILCDTFIRDLFHPRP